MTTTENKKLTRDRLDLLQEIKLNRAIADVEWEGITSSAISADRWGNEIRQSSVDILGNPRPQTFVILDAVYAKYGYKADKSNFKKLMTDLATARIELTKSR